MSVLTAVVLGLVQGIAEFLPISSSGHLAIAEHLLSIQGASNVPDFFDVLLHLGTLVAVFAAYWDDIRDMIVEFFTGIGDLAHHRTPNPVPPIITQLRAACAPPYSAHYCGHAAAFRHGAVSPFFHGAE